MALSCENTAFLHMYFQKQISIEVTFMIELYRHTISYALWNIYFFFHFLFLHSWPITSSTKVFYLLSFTSASSTCCFHYKHTLSKCLSSWTVTASTFFRLSTRFCFTSITSWTSYFSIVLKDLNFYKFTFVAPFTLS